MTENNGNKDTGNDNKRTQGGYIQGNLSGNYHNSGDYLEGNSVRGRNNFLNNNFAIFGRQGSSEALSSEKHSRIRQVLLKQVNDEVEIRINSSLHNRVYIVLDVDQNPEQIELPWASEIKVGDQPKIRLDNTDIINVFDQKVVAGRLLILGQAGSGKTTMVLKLAEELLKRAKNNSTLPVPVLFSLSSWKNDNQNIKDWLVDQLKDKYGLRKDIGKQWMNNQEIIPLLDGLDELAAERQEKCVLKINDFLHPRNWTNPLVVCSRIQEYQRYKALLKLNNSLELYSFSHQQVEQYLQSTGHLQLWDIISHDADLSQLAKTPLLLNIIVLSAQETSIQIWQQFKSSEERLSYLFDAYIRRMLKRPYKDKQPKQENNQRWLSWMAHRLIEESATEFLIEKIQPDWLKNRVQIVIYNLILWGVIATLIFVPIIMILITAWLYLFMNLEVFSELVPLDLRLDYYDNSRRTALIIYNLINWITDQMTNGMIYGMIYGLFGNLIENKIETKIVSFNPLKKVSKTAISGLIIGLIMGLGWFLINYQQTLYDWKDAQHQLPILKHDLGLNSDTINYVTSLNFVLGMYLMSNLVCGLMFGLLLGVIGNKVQTVETIKFSPKEILNRLKNGLKNWAIVGLIFGLAEGLNSVIQKDEQIFNKIFYIMRDIIENTIEFVIFGLLWNVIIQLFSGIEGQEIENKTFPNQGIWQSVINAIFISVATFIFTCLIVFVFQIRLKYKINGQFLIDILILEISFAILIGILTSGMPAIKHFILRVILWSSGSIPWNYAKFLNYCTNRLFVQRVGGSYRFMHDLLRQHFANSYGQKNPEPVQAISVGPSVPQVQNHIICSNCGHNNAVNCKYCTKCGTKLI